MFIFNINRIDFDFLIQVLNRRLLSASPPENAENKLKRILNINFPQAETIEVVDVSGKKRFLTSFYQNLRKRMLFGWLSHYIKQMSQPSLINIYPVSIGWKKNEQFILFINSFLLMLRILFNYWNSQMTRDLIHKKNVPKIWSNCRRISIWVNIKKTSCETLLMAMSIELSTVASRLKLNA